jgi:hypothetical protein
MIHIDAANKVSCYRRYANDSIDESLVNAKILWRHDRLCVVPTQDIQNGDEIYAYYGKDYWEFKLHRLDEQLKEIIQKKYVSERTVTFNEEVGRSWWDKIIR